MWTFKLKSLLMKRIYYTLSQFSLVFLAVNFNGIYKNQGKNLHAAHAYTPPSGLSSNAITHEKYLRNRRYWYLKYFPSYTVKMYETGNHGYQQNLLLLVCPSKVLASRPLAIIMRRKTKPRLFLKFYYFFRCRKDGFGHKILSLSTLQFVLNPCCQAKMSQFWNICVSSRQTYNILHF